MSARIDLREGLVAALGALGAIVLGVAAAHKPIAALALIALVLVLWLPFAAPAFHLCLLVFVTAIVPFSVQNKLGGGPGLVPSDLLLMGGLARAGVELLRAPPRGRRALVVWGLIAFLLVAGVQFVRGVLSGEDISKAGFDLRVLIGFAAVLIALPVLDDERERRRLYRGLLVLGLALGLWGLIQWFGIEFAESEDAGLRQGVDHTTSGRGQIQGGLFAFPVAVAMSFAVLLSGHVRSLWVRGLLAVVLVLNTVGMLLTYERTFWLTSVVALGLITLRAGRLQQVRALLLAPAVVVLMLSGLATIAPNELTAARERLLSLGEYGNDRSVRYRVRESQRVIEQIVQRPLHGSGLAAAIWWGRPSERVPPRTDRYAHNGYLWVAWKLGIPVALLLVAIIVAGVLWPGPPLRESLPGAVRVGTQAALFSLLIATVTFPSLNTLSITATMGVLVALCMSAGPPARRELPAPPAGA